MRGRGTFWRAALIGAVALLSSAGQLGAQYRAWSQGRIESQPVGGEEGTLVHQGGTRSYLLYTPAAGVLQKPAPLLIVLHGGHGNARRVAASTAFNELADRYGIVVAYPNALDGHWNDGRSTAPQQVDDVGFIPALIEHIARQRDIDLRRVYATGLSNGGAMTLRLACALSDRIAAFAAVVANMSKELHAACAPKRPVSLMMINGTEDPLMPWGGGEIKKGRFLGRGGVVLSAENSIRFWARHDRCHLEPQMTEEKDRDPDDGTRVYKYLFPGCSGSEVILYMVKDGGHNWPGTRMEPKFKRISGKVSRDINASEVIWEFFLRHSL